MIYLLDVNALIGFTFVDHEFYGRVRSWVAGLDRVADALATCAITELAVVRILPQITAGSITVAEGQRMLREAKAASSVPCTLLADDLGADQLPHWATLPKHTTDGHLLELARSRKAMLATCDQRIRGALLIPRF